MCLRQWRDCRLQQLIDQIDDRRQAQGALFDSQIAGHLDHVDAMLKCQQQQVDKLPVATFLAHVVILDLLHRSGQFPTDKRGAITQRTGLAIEQRHIVPRFEMADIARKIPFMFSDNFVVCDHDKPISIGAQRDVMPRMCAWHAVAIAVILHETGGSDPQSLFDIAVERAPQRAQLDLLIRKDFGDCAMLLIRMTALSQLLAAQEKPGIQRRQIVKGQPGREQLTT